MQRTDLFEKPLMLVKIEGWRRGQQKMKWLDGITNSMNMSLSRLRELVIDREAWRAAVHGITKSDMTEELNWLIWRKNLLSKKKKKKKKLIIMPPLPYIKCWCVYILSLGPSLSYSENSAENSHRTWPLYHKILLT